MSAKHVCTKPKIHFFMNQVYISLGAILKVFVDDLVRFLRESHLVRFRKTLCLGSKYLLQIA